MKAALGSSKGLHRAVSTSTGQVRHSHTHLLGRTCPQQRNKMCLLLLKTRMIRTPNYAKATWVRLYGDSSSPLPLHTLYNSSDLGSQCQVLSQCCSSLPVKERREGKKGALSCSPLYCAIRAKLTLQEVPINTNSDTKRHTGILRNMQWSDIHIAHPSVSPHQRIWPCVILLICTGLKDREVPLPVRGNPYPYSLAPRKGLSHTPWKWGKVNQGTGYPKSINDNLYGQLVLF